MHGQLSRQQLAYKKQHNIKDKSEHDSHSICTDCIKAGESRGRAPEQASDYALRAPNPLDSSAMTRCFIKISGPPNQSGPQVFCPPCPPPPLAGLGLYTNIMKYI